MSRPLKAATVKRYYSQAHHLLQAHLQACLRADNFAQRLKPRKGLAPYEDRCQWWHKAPERFTRNPCHHTLGLNIKNTPLPPRLSTWV